jgi:F-type H+-transporting ATPase subunit delta
MKDSIIVKRYADAFMAYAKEGVGQKAAYEDLKKLREIMRNNPQFQEVMQSPDINYAEKCVFIDKLLKEDFSPELIHFLRLLLEKDRIEKILDIAEYIRVTYSHGKEVEALVKTTFPLEIEVMERIKKRLEKKFNRKFKLYTDLDDSLLGGIQVIFESTIIDGTVRRRLCDLKEELSNLRVS